MLPLLSMEVPAAAARRGEQRQKVTMIAKVSISILVMSLPVLYVSVLRLPPAALFRDTTFWFLMSNSIIVVIAADSGMLFFADPAAAAYDDRPFVVKTSHAAPPSVVAASGNDDDWLLPAPVAVENQALVVRDRGGVAAMAAVNDRALVVRGGEADDGKTQSGETMLVSSSSASAVAIKNVDDDGAIVPARLTASKSLAREERARRRRSRSHSHSHALVPVTAAVQDKSVIVREEKLRRAATEGRPLPLPAPPPVESEYERLSDEELNRRVEEFIARFNREIRLQIEKEQA